MTLLFCSSKNIYSVREKEEGDMFFFLFFFFLAVHFYGSLHINQAPLLFRRSEVGGDPHIQKQNFMTFHYPRGEFVGIGKQPKILCIHFYLTFFAFLTLILLCGSRCAAQSAVLFHNSSQGWIHFLFS